MIIKLNTSSIQYTVRCQWLLSLSRYSPEFYRTYSLLQFMGMSFNGLLKHEQSKSILIQFLKIYFNIILPYSHRSSKQSLSYLFPIKNLFKITFSPILPLLFDTPVSHKQYELQNSTLCILFLQFPLYLFQTLFSSLYSQTKPAYKWQKALPILKSPYLCYSYHASIF